MEHKSMVSGYSAKLSGGQNIYVADWLPSVALQNLTQAGKYIGVDNLLAISKLDKYSIHTAILAVTEATDPEMIMDLIQHFVCTAAMDGDRILSTSFDETFKGNLFLIMELFSHVIKSQYSDFFALGLVEGQPQVDSELPQVK